jgi:hypothetical protein
MTLERPEISSASICKEISVQKEILVRTKGNKIDKEIARKSSLKQGN